MNKNTKNYRKAHNMFACNGILFKHESPRRRETFVTRKITIAVARIALWQKEKFYLGNLNAKRDWGHAKDYVQMMWMILQADKAEDWVIANGETTSVREFVSTGKGFVASCNNESYKLEIGKEVLSVDASYFRPTEVDLLIGDPSKSQGKIRLGARAQFGFNCKRYDGF